MSQTPAADNVANATGNRPEPAPVDISPDDKKDDIRKKVWSYLDKNQLSLLFSPYKKISNFKGADEAGDRIATLDVFKNAQNVKVDPDKPLQQARYVTLKAGKTLFVPTPRQRTGILSQIQLPEECDEETLSKYSTRQGVEESSISIGLDDSVKIDLAVIGCVAVSPKGWRIGKGFGFSDLEYAMLASVGAVNPEVPVVTVVHDSQVLDLPESLFDVHDVAVDYIVTPTRVIQCSGAKPRPAGILWSLLSSDRLERIRILKRLRYREWKAGKEVRLVGETEDPSELTDEIPPDDDDDDRRGPRRRNLRRPMKPRLDGDVGHDREDYRRVGGRPRGGMRGRGGRRRPPLRDDRGSENEHEADSEEEHRPVRGGGGRRFVARRRRFTRRRYDDGRGGATDEDEGRDRYEDDGGRRRPRGRRSESDTGGPNMNGEPRRGRGRIYRPGGRRPYYGDCDGSVYVGSLPRTLRVSEFKAEVRDRNVQPLRVIWRGSSGYAFLGFRTMEDAEQALEALDGLHINDHDLRLEMAKSSGSGGGRDRRRRRENPRSSGGGDDHAASEDEE